MTMQKPSFLPEPVEWTPLCFVCDGILLFPFKLLQMIQSLMFYADAYTHQISFKLAYDVDDVRVHKVFVFALIGLLLNNTQWPSIRE
jgi:hypothetical protein